MKKEKAMTHHRAQVMWWQRREFSWTPITHVIPQTRQSLASQSSDIGVNILFELFNPLVFTLGKSIQPPLSSISPYISPPHPPSTQIHRKMYTQALYLSHSQPKILSLSLIYPHTHIHPPPPPLSILVKPFSHCVLEKKWCLQCIALERGLPLSLSHTYPPPPHTHTHKQTTHTPKPTPPPPPPPSHIHNE